MKSAKEMKYQLHPIEEEVVCFYHTDSMMAGAGETVPYHRHDAYEIYLFLGGDTDLYIERNCYRLKRGDMALVVPAQLHRSVCLSEEPYMRYGINIKPFLMDKLSSADADLKHCFPVNTQEARLAHLTEEEIGRFADRFDSLQGALQDTGYGQDILVQAELARLLVLVNRISGSSGWKPENIMPPMVGEVMAYIEAHLTEEITLAELSRVFYASQNHISRQFKNATGLTIRSYLLDQRICRAKACLLEGKSVTQACLESGFSDYANFIRSFTKYVGISPGKYGKLM